MVQQSLTALGNISTYHWKLICTTHLLLQVFLTPRYLKAPVLLIILLLECRLWVS